MSAPITYDYQRRAREIARLRAQLHTGSKCYVRAVIDRRLGNYEAEVIRRTPSGYLVSIEVMGKTFRHLATDAIWIANDPQTLTERAARR